MHTSYNPWLVSLSIGVAILVSFTSLRLASRVAESNRRAGRTWLILGAISMGVGIWSMHFIGMLAFSLPIQLRYDPGLTFASLGAAVVTSGFAIKIASSQNLRFGRHVICSVVMAFGSGTRHCSYLRDESVGGELAAVFGLCIRHQRITAPVAAAARPVYRR